MEEAKKRKTATEFIIHNCHNNYFGCCNSTAFSRRQIWWNNLKNRCWRIQKLNIRQLSIASSKYLKKKLNYKSLKAIDRFSTTTVDHLVYICIYNTYIYKMVDRCRVQHEGFLFSSYYTGLYIYIYLSIYLSLYIYMYIYIYICI